MGRILKRAGSPGHARMMVADFDGLVRDGATFKLRGSSTELADGDLVAFNYPEGIGAGLTVEEDEEGLHSLVRFGPAISLRIGLEALGGGSYAFRPASHHIQLWPELGESGTGAKPE